MSSNFRPKIMHAWSSSDLQSLPRILHLTLSYLTMAIPFPTLPITTSSTSWVTLPAAKRATWKLCWKRKLKNLIIIERSEPPVTCTDDVMEIPGYTYMRDICFYCAWRVARSLHAKWCALYRVSLLGKSGIVLRNCKLWYDTMGVSSRF